MTVNLKNILVTGFTEKRARFKIIHKYFVLKMDDRIIKFANQPNSMRTNFIF